MLRRSLGLLHSTPEGTVAGHELFQLLSCPPGRFLSTSSCFLKKDPPLPPRPSLPDADLKYTFLKGSGPGGQKINKTNSAAQVTHIPTGIVVKSQATRSKAQNFTIAKRILAEKVEVLEKGPESRAMMLAERDMKKRKSADKKKRRKYRRLSETNPSKNAKSGPQTIEALKRPPDDGEDDPEEVAVKERNEMSPER